MNELHAKTNKSQPLDKLSENGKPKKKIKGFNFFFSWNALHPC